MVALIDTDPRLLTCDCRYPEREAQHRADWDDMPKTGWPGEHRGAKNGRLWPPMPVWHDPLCASLETYPLQPLSTIPQCAKCGMRVISTTFHEAAWSYTPHHHDYWRTDLYKWRCLLTHRYHPVEHLDRKCSNCGWEWLETTADA